MAHPLCLCLSLCLAGPPAQLGCAGERFTVDGHPTFLLGISYYGGLAADAATVVADLDQMKASGFNWLRVWVTWAFFDQNLAVVTPRGEPREPYLARLVELVRLAGERGLVVDVTFNRAAERAGQPPLIPDLGVHQKAVEVVSRVLLPYRNVYLDLANERCLPNKFVGYEDLRRLRDTVRAIDPARLMTASDTGDIDEAKVRGYLGTAGLDFIAPHAPRSSASAKANRARSEALLALQRQLGYSAPVHYQEPFRRGFSQGWEPTLDDFTNDLTGAIDGGAAGWCLHNGDQRFAPEGRPRRSFDLRPGEGQLFEQLDAVERAVVAGLKARFGTR